MVEVSDTALEMETVTPAAAASPFLIRVTAADFDGADRPAGSSTYIMPNRYETLGLARCVAERLDRYVDCGVVLVIDADGHEVREALPAPVVSDDCPF
jgi:hypothetical protein